MESLTGRWDRRIKLAVCTVNQWVLDFQGNYERIMKTCREAHKKGASVRLGPELEIPGYGCSDHFMEFDTEMHSWEILAKIVKDSKELQDLLIITGMPVRIKCCLYNCMISIINGKIIFIRPKLTLCDDDIYRETRYFVPWTQRKQVVQFKLPENLGLEQKTVPFGDAVIISGDHIKIGFEICEELWTANSPSVDLALSGVDIICNGSGSHHILGKSHRRINELVLGASAKLGVTYLYANHRGCDGDRLYYDGMSTIAQNGKIYAQIRQFDIEETELAMSVLDLNDSVVYRSRSSSTTKESARNEDFLEIVFDDHLLPKKLPLTVPKSTPLLDCQILSPIEELCHGPPAWLWHYLRRSGMSGYFVPLSGGQDSAAVVVMVRLMCDKVVKAIEKNPERDDPAYYFLGEKVTCSARELCSKVLFTCYMGTKNSSEFTKNLARGLANDIGSTHSSVVMDSAVDAFMGLCKMAYNFVPSFASNDWRQTTALENVQARIRMVTAYLFAQVGLIYAGRRGGLLVLGTANVDESLVGYVTKYDCSSADLNPIGSVSKSDLREFLALVNERSDFSHLKGIYDSVPTAELRPLVNGEVAQTDEAEIGLTYDEMSQIGRLRRPGCKGPFAMFLALVPLWRPRMTHEEIADKVILFFRRYARNRHKATVSTPGNA
uniref:Glutamine-dependent NAD(+) synthetase n=1 Tax=Steinernema glaseri TaxID=37863 RepID=A0A1I7YUW2_9BILA